MSDVKEDSEDLADFKKINNELREQVNEVLGIEGAIYPKEKFNDITLLMAAVNEILQFLEREFPNALNVNEKPVQKIIFQNYRFRLYLRLAKKLKASINRKTPENIKEDICNDIDAIEILLEDFTLNSKEVWKDLFGEYLVLNDDNKLTEKDKALRFWDYFHKKLHEQMCIYQGMF